MRKIRIKIKVHHPQWQHAKDLLKSGVIGKLIQVDGVFSYNNAHQPTNIRNDASTGGGDCETLASIRLAQHGF